MSQTRQIASRGSAFHSAVPLALLAVAVFVSIVGGVWLTFYTGRIAAIWIANALIVACLMKSSAGAWPRILVVSAVANFAANIVCHDALMTALVFPVCNVVEVLIVAVPLRRFGLDIDFARPNALIAFYGLSFVPATVISAALAGFYFQERTGAAFLPSAVQWYAADALGLAIFVPPLVTVRLAAFRKMFEPQQRKETFALIGLLVLTLAVVVAARGYPLGFLFLPVVVLLSFQRGFEGGAIGLAVSAGYLLASILFLDGPVGLAGHTVRDRILIAQIFVTVTGLSVMLVGAALEVRRRLENGLATAIARAELAREEAQVARVAAEQASSAKSMFLANMSHELRTPLNAVIGFSETMQEEIFGPLGHPKYKEYSGLISKAGAHLLDLISDILDMSRIEAGKLELNRESVDVSTLVHECVRLIEDAAGRGGLELAVDLSECGIAVEADRRALKQIMLNLLSNAVKFTPAGGRVEIRVGCGGGGTVLSVRDTGIGIPADRIPHAGNPFVQFHRHTGRQGTGLGLALVRTLAQLHGGDMHIESAAGKGTTVAITLPAATPARAAA